MIMQQCKLSISVLSFSTEPVQSHFFDLIRKGIPLFKMIGNPI